MIAVVWYFITSARRAAVAARPASDRWTKATRRGASCSLTAKLKRCLRSCQAAFGSGAFQSQHMWNHACERDAPDFCPPPSITGFSIGLYSDHSHHHVLCSHIYGWHSPHGHLVLLDKGKRKAWLQWLKEKQTNKKKHCLLNMNCFFFSFFPHFQLYKIRPKRTRPQALLFLCMILLLIVLHTSYMIYSLASQYVMYGSQKYLVQVSPCGPELRIGGGLANHLGPARVWAAGRLSPGHRPCF